MNKELLSIIIPAWNEEKTLERLVDKVLKIDFSQVTYTEIIIVDDASTDNTSAVAETLQKKNKNVLYSRNRNNLGKSQTVRKGILKSSGSVIVIQDADLEYNPNEIAELLDLMRSNDLDAVYGNRFGKKNRVIYWKNYLGNKFLSLVSNIFTYPRIHVWIPDMEVCHKMIRGDVARSLAKGIVSTSRFGLEPEITAKLSRYKIDNKHLKFGVAPSSYSARTIEEGKKMSAFKDGTKALKEIVRFNIQR